MIIGKVLYLGEDYLFIKCLEPHIDKDFILNNVDNLDDAYKWLDSVVGEKNVLMVDGENASIDAFELHNTLNEKGWLVKNLFVLLLNESKPPISAKAFEIGIDDLLVKTLNFEDIILRIQYLSYLRVKRLDYNTLNAD